MSALVERVWIDAVLFVHGPHVRDREAQKWAAHQSSEIRIVTLHRQRGTGRRLSRAHSAMQDQLSAFGAQMIDVIRRRDDLQLLGAEASPRRWKALLGPREVHEAKLGPNPRNAD